MHHEGFDDRGVPPGMELRDGLDVGPRIVAQQLRDDGGPAPVLIDCRDVDEWEKARISGSHLIPLGILMADPAGAAEELREEHGDRDFVVVCHHGVRSRQAALALQAVGLRSVRSLAGGIDLWSRSVDPSVPRY